MQVSAISVNHGIGYSVKGNMPFYNSRSNETIGDTVFNSLASFSNRKSVPDENLPQVLDNINEWKNFCHKQILDGKLNVIA